MCFNSKTKTKCFKFNVNTKQQCINITILLWEHILVLLHYLQASIQRYEWQHVRVMYEGKSENKIPYFIANK
jgi:hypothetical protein